MIFEEIFRLYLIIRVALNYGLDELIPKTGSTLSIRLGRSLFFWIKCNYAKFSLEKRLRLALQELGPVWIKFGQMLSTRRDLFPSSIIDELAFLQDKVKPFDGSRARSYIENAIGKPIEHVFDEFQQKPLASASIAQVHSARLKNGKEIVIKVIRPDIFPTIKADIRLIRRLAHWMSCILPNIRRFQPVDIVKEYQKTLLEELDLRREAINTIQLRHNFERSAMLYVPEVYLDYCSKTVMVMERIYGIRIDNIVALKKQGTNMNLLAERGVQVFFTQVFRDSFFHADMHPGNVFVSLQHPKDPQYIAIDCGIVGSLKKEDQRFLAESFIAFFNRNYNKVARLHVDSGLASPDTDIKDFEFAIRAVCEPMFEKPLAEISFGHILVNFFITAKRFNIKVKPQLVLLQKTLLYIEGIGRQLYPQLDLWKTAKPFLENWVRDQISFPAIMRAFMKKAPYWTEKFIELPELILENFKQHSLLQKSLDRVSTEIRVYQVRKNQSRFLFGIGTTLLISGILLITQHIDNQAHASTWLIIAGITSWVFGWKRGL